MTPLQKKMAAFGFESNDDYQYHLDSLFSVPNQEINSIRTLHIEGEQQRRKTAFANALACAMEYPHHLYYDFSQLGQMEGKVKLPEIGDEDGIVADPVSDFDHVMSEACAFSEADETILILDQLHLADFREHIRLYHFITEQVWEYSGNQLIANTDKLVLMIISAEPLYHSLQSCSFRVWVSRVSQNQIKYCPGDFELNDSIYPVMQALSDLFLQLGLSPTYNEYKKILHDAQFNIKIEEHLLASLYGWMEGVERKILYSPQLKPYSEKVIVAIHEYLGLHEVELHESEPS